MDKQFDELSKSLAEGVSRREALKKFGISLAGVLLAAVGLGGTRAGAQSSSQCCTWLCQSFESKKQFHTKTCGSPCPYPNIQLPIVTCTQTKSISVSDCTAYK